MQKKILQKDDKVLHKIAEEVKISDIKTPKIKKILGEMSVALSGEDDGVAIAAPQIGYSLRIFVVSGKVFVAGFGATPESRRAGSLSGTAVPALPLDPTVYETPHMANSVVADQVFINPKISKLSREKVWVPEGCLSVRPLYGKTFRSKKATVEAYDENGKKFKRGASDLLAQIFQHETDHLNGILFIDHAKEVKAEELPKKK